MTAVVAPRALLNAVARARGAVVACLGVLPFLFGTALAWPAESQSQPDWLARLPKGSLPLKKADRFEVNLENKSRMVLRKNRNAGLLELTKLAGTAQLEEAWIFLPDENPEGKTDSGTWVEVGIEENGQALDPSLPYFAKVSVDQAYIQELKKRFRRLELAHIHPLRRAKILSAKRENPAVPGKKIEAWFASDSSMPSYQDMLNIAREAIRIHREPSKTVSFSGYVCSTLGALRFSLLPEGVTSLQDAVEEDLVTQIQEFRQLAGERAPEIYRNAKSEEQIHEIPAVFCRDLKSHPWIQGHFDAEFVATDELKRLGEQAASEKGGAPNRDSGPASTSSRLE